MRAATLILLVLAMTNASNATTPPPEWRTRAERTAFRETSDYAETVAYCERLAAASPWVRYSTFGTSPEGRPLPLLVVSRDRAFTPEAARKTGKPIVLVQNGIHSGEIDGKEASLALVREIAVTKSLAALVEDAILVVIPIYNVDGHERSSPYNRINQNGPESMGWRATAQGYNLNRDYLKADAPETRALLALFDAWQPHLFVDTHVTDGADFQYDVLYTLEADGYVAPEVGRYVTDVFEPRVRPAMERAGHIVESYFNPRDYADISKGIERMVFTPRFSNGFGALVNRPTILVETHMFKTFERRIDATYDLLVETLRAVNAEPKALVEATRAADAAAARLGGTGGDVPLTLEVTDTPRTITFRGVEFRFEESDVSGTRRIVYGDAPRDFEMPRFDELRVTKSVAAPRAYVVPGEWTEVVERLRAHGIALERLEAPVEAELETYRLESPTWSPAPFEGHHPVRFTARAVRERRTLDPGDVVVRLDQPKARLVVHLLEPEAPDSLAAWGFFDTIFEQKEYGEGYVLEKLAREMLANDPALEREFKERLAADPKFAADARARLNFFYRRSPYWDSKLGAYPVVRLTGPLQLKTRPF
jgi:hypothetical protein